MKKFLIGFTLFLVLISVAYFYFFQVKVTSKLNTINVVPPNAVFIIDIEEPFELWNRITQGEIWQYLKTNSELAEIGKSIDSLNASFQQNKLLLDMVASRPVTVSAHKIRGDEFDLLYAIDLTKASRFSFIKDYLENLVGDDLKVTKRTYHDTEIIELNFKSSHELMYLYIKSNLIILSTTHVLIENSIDQLDEPVIARDLDYLEVSKLTDDVGVNIYIQHAYFKEYLKQWVSDESTTAFEFIESLIYSAINITIDDQFLTIAGFSNLQDSINSYAQIVHRSGVGKIEIQKMVPDNSLFFMSMGFDSFSKFYQNLESKIENSIDGEAYFENKEKLEKFLNISVEEHFLSWIGDEAGIVQIHPTGKSKTSGYAVVLKANDIDVAKEKLDYIKAQIKKKTPVKFKGIEYKGHHINFLSVKGLFKVLLGKMFSKLDKPYYTIIDDFVVFSNHPGTLAQLISYNLEDRTLSENEQFKTYLEQFDDESSLFFYINSKQIVPDSKEYLSPEYWNVLNKNKDYIESFPLMGLQIKPDGKLLSTSIILNYMPKQEISDWNHLFVPLATLSLDTVVTIQPKEEEQISIDDIFPDDLNAKVLTDTYENGQNRFEASLKNGLKDGSYKEYDSLGNVIVKGHYKMNEKTGVWKYYDSDGNLLRKDRFRN
jgi:antitoxin component YwqK of YwqJK toxin-antitoxin module